MYDDQLTARADSSLVNDIEAAADRTNLKKSEVIRRLLHLGINEVESTGDVALLTAGREKTPVDAD
ncbi:MULTISPECIES: hypothetical protein [Halobacterium]|uniref:hypothetical protein n=1 Tax=Halobacterium TaxID=2239 RepID=UPI0019655CB9|nr:hypothetical protein [Halobacterium sp. GSL-19]QRY21775.1 hypothetical protein JT689_01550 [Halobacterium sp. GSL-19]